MMHVWPQERKIEGEHLRLSAIIEGKDRRELYYRIPLAWKDAISDQADAWTIATVLFAMKSGTELVIHGTVSPSLLENLEEFQAIWSCWRPSMYRIVKISSAIEREAPRAGSETAIVSFSGGVDACFTVYQHANRLRGRRTRQLGAGLMVHGFDLPVAEEGAFAQAHASAEKIMKSVNVPLIPLQTNWRDCIPVDWEDGFGTAAFSCLMFFAKKFNAGLLAGGESHADLATYLPWGSNPATDPFLSNQSFRMVHDSGEYNRVQKVAQLTKWPSALEHLRVCWEGPKTGGNCGRCEKCIRTILDFRVVDGGCPPCFPSDIDDSQIATIRLRNRCQAIEIAAIIAEARRRNRDKEPWVELIEKKLDEFGKSPSKVKEFGERAVRKLRRLTKIK
jgi:hypothetical protein